MSDINAKELAERFLSILDKKYNRVDLSKYDYIADIDSEYKYKEIAEELWSLINHLKEAKSGTFEYLDVYSADELAEEIPEYQRLSEEDDPIIHDVDDYLYEVLYLKDSITKIADDLGDFDDDRFSNGSIIYIGFKKSGKE